MGRILGSILIFAGWASIPFGAIAGLVMSKFLGLNLVEGDLPPQTVYGFSVAVVFLVFVAATLLLWIPLVRAMFAVNPSRSLDATAFVMAAVGIILIPDQLGRAFGFPILVGAAAMAYGRRQLRLEASASGANAIVGPAAGRSGRAPTWIFDTVELADSETPDPGAGPGAAIDSATSAQVEPATANSPASAVADAGPGYAVAAPAAPGRRKSTRKAVSKTVAEMSCQWCSALVPVGATSCPTCNVPLVASETRLMTIPGVTEISPELRAYAAQARTGKKRESLLKVMFSDTSVPQTIDGPPPSDGAALRPPTPELRAEMARLDAEIAAGRPDSGGDDALDAAAGPPEATLEGPSEAPPEART